MGLELYVIKKVYKHVGSCKLIRSQIKLTKDGNVLLREMVSPTGHVRSRIPLIRSSKYKILPRYVYLSYWLGQNADSGKVMIARAATAQDDITGDGTTSVVLMVGELLKQADRYISEGLHPRIITDGYEIAKTETLKVLTFLVI